MRKEPIQPAELRAFLVAQVKLVKSQTIMAERDKDMMISALENVRHMILDDFTFYDQEPKQL
jgi:hypothetical protein